MKNIFYKTSKSLKRCSKYNKSIKYSAGLVLSFLMVGNLNQASNNSIDLDEPSVSHLTDTDKNIKQEKRKSLLELEIKNEETSKIMQESETPLSSNYNKTTSKSRLNIRNSKSLKKLLNKKNRELKNLYLQNDFIIKPEYLEWQVLLNTFYTNSSRGKRNNIINQEVIRDPKSINLGVALPIKMLQKKI